MLLTEYGLTIALIALASVILIVWITSHFRAAPGKEISVFFGLAKYTKKGKLENELTEVTNELAPLSILRTNEVVEERPGENLNVFVESAYNGEKFLLKAKPRASVEWLIDQAKKKAKLKDNLDTGALHPLVIRWILVDTSATEKWKSFTIDEISTLYALVKTEEDVSRIENQKISLEEAGIHNDIVFQLFLFPLYLTNVNSTPFVAGG